MKRSSETLAVGALYRGCLAVIKDSDNQNERRGTMKKTSDRKCPEQSKVKL
jgi:hypothetical protein